MPPLVFHPVARTVEVVALWQRNGNQRRNVIHYNYAAATPTGADLDNLCDDLANSLYGLFGVRTVTTNTTNFYGLIATDIDHAGGAQGSATFSLNGSVFQPTLPGNCAFCLTKRTGVTGPSHRGRYYLGDLPEDFFDTDSLAFAYLPALNVIAGHMLGVRNAGQFLPAVASKEQGLSTLITNITWDFTADSQRRRLEGRGI